MRETIHPGETLCEDIDALGISASQLARHIELPMNRITQILNGNRAITGDTPLLRYFRRILAESAKNLRTSACRTQAQSKDCPAGDSGTCGSSAVSPQIPASSVCILKRELV